MKCKIQIINYDTNIQRTYLINSTSEFSNEIWQKELSLNHKKQRTISCGCGIWLSVVKKDDKYFLRTYPNQPKTHLEECIFQNNAEEKNDNTFSLNIFLEHKAKNSIEKQEYVKQEEHKTHNTFYDFCIEVLKNAQAFAFNSANKNLECFKYNITKENLLKKIYVSKINIKQAFSIDILISQLRDKNIYFSYGVTNQSIESFYETNSFIITVKNQTKNLIFENNKIDYAIKRLKIFDNFIKPPYFYFLTTSYGKVVRLFLYPILEYKNTITFIESEKERQIVKQLIDKNCVFIKPLSDEFNQLAKKQNRPFFPLAYRPDVFLFQNNKCTIVEISGKMGAEYDRLLQEKEEYYKQLKNFNYIRIE